MSVPLQFPRTDGSPDPWVLSASALVGDWLAIHPQPLVELPPARRFEQWAAWLRAEGFIEAIEQPGYYGEGLW